MITTVIQGKTYAEILSLLDDPWVELAEIRLDLCPLSDAEIEDLFSNTDTPLIATCRANWGASVATASGEIAGVAAREATRMGTAGHAAGEAAGMGSAGPVAWEAAGMGSADEAAGGRNQNPPKMQHPPVKIEGGASKSPENATALSPEVAAGVNSALSASGISPAEAERRMTIAIQAGARFADLEIEAEAGWSKRFRDLCHDYGVEIIRSWHDFTGTPSLDYLRQIQARCYRYGADIAKIVTTASCPADCDAVLSLYMGSGEEPCQISEEPCQIPEEPCQNRPKMSDPPSKIGGGPSKMAENAGGPGRSTPDSGRPEPRRLIAFAMGPVGRETRLECLRLGAPFSYAGVPEEARLQKSPKTSATPGLEGGSLTKSAENVGETWQIAGPGPNAEPGPQDLGQYAFEEMHRLVYGDFRGFWRVGGDLAVPCSKSFAQRAIVCAALAEGRSRLRAYTPCADSEAAIAVARALGATVRKDPPGASDPADSATLVIDGIGVAPGGAPDGVRNQNPPKMQHPPVKIEGGASKSADNAAAPGQAAASAAVATPASAVVATAASAAVATPAAPGQAAASAAVATAASASASVATPSAAAAAATPAPATPPTLNVAESGLLARLCIPLMAAIARNPVTITGEKTLLRRPLKGVQNVMASFGVPIRSERVPITVAPPLIPGAAEVSGADGSQIISGLLTALPLCAKNSTLYISEPKRIPYMFITEDILRKFGVKLKSEMEGDERMIEDQDWSGCTQISFSIKGGQHYKAADLTIEGDWSAAANFLTAGAIFGKAEVSGLNTDSLQADLAIADILVQAGAIVSELDASVCVSKAPLEGFEADLGNAPDLFPICSVLAAFCDGETVLHGVDRLHGKESDRAAAILEMLEAFGVSACIDGNDLFISGETLACRLLNGRLLRGSGSTGAAAASGNPASPAIAPRVFRTFGDHRMAMAIKIASMGADSPVVLDDPDCVAKSFPEFWEQFDY